MTFEELETLKAGDKILVAQSRYNYVFTPPAGSYWSEKGEYIECVVYDISGNYITVEYNNHQYCYKYDTIILFGLDGRMPLFKLINNKQKTMNISTIAKRIFDKDTKTLIKASFLKEDLSLTEKGEEALYGLLFSDKKDELVKLAQEELDDKKEECCK